MRRGRTVGPLGTVLVAMALVALGACAGSTPVSAPTPPAPEPTVAPAADPSTVPSSAPVPLADAEAAVRVCAALRAHTNGLVREINEAVAGIAGRSPEDRLTALLGGLAAAEAVSTDHRETLTTLDLTGLPEAEQLLAELDAGAALAVDALAAERELLDEELDQVADDDVHGRVSQAFNAVERAMSVSEPAIGRYERQALRLAFLGEPTCRHVIQPFREDTPDTARPDTSADD
jgi:hypothetical protein